jgi:hypothetical protein
MSANQTNDNDRPHQEEEEVLTPTESRQGVLGHNVRTVLFASLALAVLVGVGFFVYYA